MEGKDIWLLMLPAFFECLVLVGIHSYLGIHVIKRKVIFVDLAFAQIAALGILVAFLFGIPPHTKESFVFAVGLTFIGAVVIALTRFKESKIPQEAIIGLIYAIAAALAILLVDKASHGAEHIKEILTGSILWVSWRTIGATATVYALVGLFHYIFRDRFLLISENAEKAWAAGINVRLWDFLFYSSFGLVITMSVDTAGVLIVFVFLVAPAIIAIIITDRMVYQLLIGWGLGAIVTIVGLFVAYVEDLPTGPAVIAAYAVAIVVIATVLYNLRSRNRLAALRNTVLAGGMLVGGFLLMFPAAKLVRLYLGEGIHDHGAHQEFRNHFEAESNAERGGAGLEGLSGEELASAVEKAVDVSVLQKYFVEHGDADVRSAIVSRVLDLDRNLGAHLAVEFLKTDPPLFFRQNVVSRLNRVAKEPYEFDVSQPFSSDVNQRMAERIERECR